MLRQQMKDDITINKWAMICPKCHCIYGYSIKTECDYCHVPLVPFKDYAEEGKWKSPQPTSPTTTSTT